MQEKKMLSSSVLLPCLTLQLAEHADIQNWDSTGAIKAYEEFSLDGLPKNKVFNSNTTAAL